MRLLVWVLAASLSLTAGASAQVAGHPWPVSDLPPRADDVQIIESPSAVPFGIEDIDGLIETAMADGHVPGLSAAIVTADGPVWFGAYGQASFSPPAPVEVGTLFMLASVSKVVTGTAFMQLVEQGVVGLDDDIDTHLPFVVDNPTHPAVPLTPRTLLSHVSSIDDNWAVMPYYAGDSPYPLGEYLAAYLAVGGDLYSPTLNYRVSSPGTEWHYSNIGLATVGYLAEQVSGLPFDAYCADSLFVPLGMDETSWHLADLDASHIAMPYRWNGVTYMPYGHYGYSDYPSGQLRTSADQLARFLQAYLRGGELDGNRILEEGTVADMLTPHYPGVRWNQGLVWYRDGAGWQHGGGDRGVSTIVSFGRVEGVGVVVLTNGENASVTSYVRDLLYDYADQATGVDIDAAEGGQPLVLHAPHPNPVTSSVRLAVDVPAPMRVEAGVFTVGGRQVRDLSFHATTAGRHDSVWDARDDHGRPVSSGVYVCRVQAGNLTRVQRIAVVR